MDVMDVIDLSMQDADDACDDVMDLAMDDQAAEGPRPDMGLPPKLPGLLQAFRWPYLTAHFISKHSSPLVLAASCLSKSHAVSTHFSGVGSAELALWLTTRSSASLTGFQGPNFRMVSSCECDRRCRQACLGSKVTPVVSFN